MTLAAHLTHVLQEGWPINSQQTTPTRQSNIDKTVVAGGCNMQNGELQHEDEASIFHDLLLASFYRSIESKVFSN